MFCNLLLRIWVRYVISFFRNKQKKPLKEVPSLIYSFKYKDTSPDEPTSWSNGVLSESCATGMESDPWDHRSRALFLRREASQASIAGTEWFSLQGWHFRSDSKCHSLTISNLRHRFPSLGVLLSTTWALSSLCICYWIIFRNFLLPNYSST